MRRVVTLVMVVSILAGCGIFGRDEEVSKDLKPSPLPGIEDRIKVVERWSRDVGGADKKSFRLVPAVDDRAVYAAAPEGRIVAVDKQSGKPLWSKRVDAEITGGVGLGEGLVIVGTIGGEVLAFNARDGGEEWKQKVSSEVLAPPGIGSGRAVVHAVDGRVFGLATTDGSQAWTFREAVPSLSLRGSSTPMIAQGAAVIGFASGKLVAVRLDNGRTLWDLTVAEPRGRNEVERMVDIEGRPVLFGNVLYAASFQGKLMAIGLRDRRILWARDLSTYNDVSVDGDNVYVTDEGGNVLAIDRLTGTLLWRQEQLKRRGLSAPAVLGDYVIIGDFEGYLHVLAKTDGRLQGRIKLSGGPVRAAPISEQGTAYVVTQGGNLVAITVP
ncbi:MAG: outer membrane protein assembly factor BamB [Gammaproteobacteria bacterium]|nr:outer membrane protein assembly factor BamB [Gammaproteobacteria bacterium]